MIEIHGNGEQVRARGGWADSRRRGEIAAVMGPSGSGRSTLLHMLARLDRPTAGQLLIDGRDLTAVRSLDAFRVQAASFLFQLHNLLPTLTALANVKVPMHSRPLGRRKRRRRAKDLLTLIRLPDRMGHLPSQLSGGPRQKVAIARALASWPRLILAGEPTGNPDAQSRAEVIALLRRLNQELGATAVIVTHDSTVAHHTERILIMRDGALVHEHGAGIPYEEDLETFLDFFAGPRPLAGDGDPLAQFTPDRRASIHHLAERL
jgi:putative ABC transport system ATP-binding protein